MIAAYIMSSFFVRTLDHSMHAYSQMYYFGHVAIAGTWVFFQIPGVTRVLKAIADTGETFQTVVDGESEEKAALLKDSSTDSLPASADVSESRKDE